MADNVQVTKNNNENNAGVIKRFTRRVQESGIIRRVRSNRYAQRQESAYTKKTSKLSRIRRKEEVTKMIKMGKMPEQRGRRRR